MDTAPGASTAITPEARGYHAAAQFNLSKNPPCPKGKTRWGFYHPTGPLIAEQSGYAVEARTPPTYDRRRKRQAEKACGDEIDRGKKLAMNFSQALEALKQGQSIARQGWNGKGMFLWLNKGSRDKSRDPSESAPSHVDGISASLFELGDTNTNTRLPNINMRAATGSTVTGWLASQTDMLAEDWDVAQQ